MAAAQILRAVHAALVSSVLVLTLFLDNHDVNRPDLWIKALLIAALLIQAVFMTSRGSIVEEYSSVVRHSLILASLFAVYVIAQGGLESSYPSYAFLSRFLSYFAFGLVLIPIIIRPWILRRVIMTAAICGFMEALLGIAQRFTGSWNPISPYLKGSAENSFGLFQYENSFGAYASLLIPLSAGLLTYRMADSWGDRTALSIKRLGAVLNAEIQSGAHFLLIAVLVMTVALLVSGARESVLVMTVFYALAVILFIPGRMKIALILLVAAAAGCVAFMADPKFLDNLIAGFDRERLIQDTMTRIDIARMNLRLFAERPWTGWGMGMYKYVSPRYLTAGGNEFNIWNYYIHGHSSVMDLMVEAGVCGGALAMGIVITPFTRILGAVKRDPSRFRKIMKVQSVMAMIPFAMMLISDSHLRTPAIAYLLILQIGVFIGSYSPSADPDTDVRLRPVLHWRSEPLRVAVVGIGLIVIAGILSHDLILQSQVYRVKMEPMPKERRIQRLIRLEPNNPDHWHQAASIYRNEALESKSAVARENLLERSKEAADTAMRLIPDYAPYAHLMGEIMLLQDDPEGAIAMYQKALDLSPTNIKFKVDLMLVYVYLAADTASILQRDLWTARARILYKELESVRGSDGKGVDSIQIRSATRKKQFMEFVQGVQEERAVLLEVPVVGGKT